MPGSVKKEILQGDWDKYYRRYQRRLADDYLIPSLNQWGIVLDQKRFLEIGCGDGGCGAAFHDKGCSVVMMDIEQRLVDIARVSNEREGVDARVFVGDVFDEGGDFYKEGPFDIVMFRDVMEHLENPERALRVIRSNLADGGVVFVVFPPYFSPYGAHQQILPKKKIAFLPYNKLPYLQLLPRGLFRTIVRGDTSANHEVTRLSDIRLTIGKFERAVTAGGFRVRDKKFYLSRPTFALRYGLPVIGGSVIGRIPLVRELLITASYYLLESDGPRPR